MTQASQLPAPAEPPPAAGPQAPPAGLAHVATLSFLAARAAAPIAFWVALAGGVALARAAVRGGLRRGYGAGLAAVLETAAIVGPARLGGPIVQAATAPLVGRLEARGAGQLRQVLTCAAIRLLYNGLASAFFIWVIAGGVDAYAGTYDALLGRLPLVPRGAAGALGVTAIGLVGWAAFAGVVQVRIYTRGLRRWPADAVLEDRAEEPPVADRGRHRFDPRAVAVAALVAFGLLLASTAWPLLGAVAAWLVATWAFARPDRDGLRAAAALALAVVAVTFAFTAPGVGIALGARRAARAGLLVAVGAWLHGAAGAAGLREVTRRSLGRLRRLPAVPEAAAILEQTGAERRLGGAVRSLLGAIGPGPRRPIDVVDAVLAWVATESARFRPSAGAPAGELELRLRDLALVLLAAAPAAALVAG